MIQIRKILVALNVFVLLNIIDDTSICATRIQIISLTTFNLGLQGVLIRLLGLLVSELSHASIRETEHMST